MKNILKLILVTILFGFCTKVHAQIDTLNYVKQFEINKANYIGQPFSHLLNDMVQYKPKTVNSFINIWGKNLVADSDFNFSTLEEQRKKQTVYLIVYWQTPLVHSDAFLLSKQNHFNFTSAEEIFYGNKIIGDIKVYKR